MTPTPSEPRFTDVGRGITLCHQSFGDPADPPLLLVMGLGMQMIAWPDELCSRFAERGFHVIRFDNRDAGLSTAIDSVPPPNLLALTTRRFASGQYTLEDMADDTAGLVRELDTGPVHVLGASLGGMVAQTLAAHHPGTVATLTSVMSTTGHRLKGLPAPAALKHLLRPLPRDRDAYVEGVVAIFSAVGSPGFPADLDVIRENAGRAYDRATNPAGTGRQLAAVMKSGNRTHALRRIEAPALVVHGDSDRLVHVSGGRATAAAIPGAELMLIEGMGHDFPAGMWDQLIEAVSRLARSATPAAATR